MADVQETRKRNLRELIRQWHGPTNLAKKLKYSGPSYLSQLIGPSKPVTEKTARHMETVLELPPGWLDDEHTIQPPPRPVADSALMASSALTVLAELNEAGVNATARQVAELLTLAWERTGDRGAIDHDYIKRIVALLKTGQ